MTIKKQFIAGARCPVCQALDKIQRCTEETLTGTGAYRIWMTCIACGMEKPLDETPPASAETEARKVQPVTVRPADRDTPP